MVLPPGCKPYPPACKPYGLEAGLEAGPEAGTGCFIQRLLQIGFIKY